jgi:hypothetical protein
LLRNHSPSVNRNAALKTGQDLGSEQSLTVRDSQTSVFPLPDLTDMVRTADRPAFFELNDGGNLNLHKFARGAGSLAATYREHLRSRGYAGSCNPQLASAAEPTAPAHRHSQASR